MAQPYYAEGDYVVEWLESAFTETKGGEGKTPKPMIVVKVRVNAYVPDDDNPPVPEEKQFERTIRIVIGDDPKYKDFPLMKLRHAGWGGTDFSRLNDEMEGEEFVAVCKHNGDYENWDLPLPERESKPLENKPKIAKELNALFGKTLKETAPKVPTAPKPKLNHPDAEAYRPGGEELSRVPAGKGDDDPPDDEIPF